MQNKVDSLEELIIEAQGKPFYVSPGYFYFGTNKDLEPGRYTATPKKDGSFEVLDKGERKVVNINLGTGSSYKVDSYTFVAEEGYTLHTEGGCYLTLLTNYEEE